MAVTKLIQLFQSDPTATGTYQVFTGLFRFSDPSSYRDELSVALADDENGTDPFYQALCRYLSNREYDLIEANEWDRCRSS